MEKVVVVVLHSLPRSTSLLPQSETLTTKQPRRSEWERKKKERKYWKEILSISMALFLSLFVAGLFFSYSWRINFSYCWCLPTKTPPTPLTHQTSASVLAHQTWVVQTTGGEWVKVSLDPTVCKSNFILWFNFIFCSAVFCEGKITIFQPHKQRSPPFLTPICNSTVLHTIHWVVLELSVYRKSCIVTQHDCCCVSPFLPFEVAA